MRTAALILIIRLVFLSFRSIAGPNTDFTYQGRLTDAGEPAQGTYDVTFSLYTDLTSGTLVGRLTNNAVFVTNGVFTTVLSFGEHVFTGADHWLEIGVRTNGDTAFDTLAPRQPITPVPYAIYAASAGNALTALTATSVPAANIVGPLPAALLPNTLLSNNQSGVSLDGVFGGDGGGLTNLMAAGIVGALSEAQLGANVARLSIPNTALQATGTVVVSSGFITAANMVAGGSGYSSAPIVSITDATGSNAVITATVSGGAVISLEVQNPGAHYTSDAAITIAAPPSNGIQMFSSDNQFRGVNSFTNVGNLFVGAFSGDGSGLKNLKLTGPTANENTAQGHLALDQNSTGNLNSAFGSSALQSNTEGHENSAFGYGALQSNTTGSYNTGIGIYALNANTVGQVNTAVGWHSLAHNQTGGFNSALGNEALRFNIVGNYNTAVGWAALLQNNADYNSAFGFQALRFNTTGHDNTAIGVNALISNTSGNANTANGVSSLLNNATGNENTAVGVSSLSSNTGGSDNTSMGMLSLFSNTTGNNNSALGFQALYSNTTASDNTAVGFHSLLNNTVGSKNTAVGELAMLRNTTGFQNAAFGGEALQSNTTGSYNTAIGMIALGANTTGSENTAVGDYALQLNKTGGRNTSIGSGGLLNSVSGSFNCAVGFHALAASISASYNTALGYGSLFNLTTGTNNIGLGTAAGSFIVTGNNNVAIGSPGSPGESGSIRIGTAGTHTRTYLSGVVHGNGSGLSDLSADAVVGGLTTNLMVLTPGGGTNTLFFVNGILRSIE